jgi:hypothetical protein
MAMNMIAYINYFSGDFILMHLHCDLCVLCVKEFTPEQFRLLSQGCRRT